MRRITPLTAGSHIHFFPRSIQWMRLQKRRIPSFYYILLFLLLAPTVSAFAPTSLPSDKFLLDLTPSRNHNSLRLKKAIRNGVHEDSMDVGETVEGYSNSEEKVLDLETLGWQPHFAEQFKKMLVDDDSLTPARIIEVRNKGIHVLAPGIDEIISNSAQRRRDAGDAQVVVGDWVLLNREHKQKKTLERKSLIKRRAPGPGRKIQLIAANLDTVFVVSSCNQDFNVARLERYVAMALEANVSPVIVLTKRDLLCEDDDESDYDDELTWLLDFYVEEANSISGGTIPVICLDARGDEPLLKLAEWCRPGQTVAFLGSSGVGKSTLVNSLLGSQIAETGAIHTDSGQGRHTTTRKQLYFLSNGCAVLDTPGLREIQLIDALYGVTKVFADLVELSHQCRFNDCKHEGEPGCAIAEAVDNGELDIDRLARWKKLVAEELSNSETLAERKPPRKTKKKRK